MYEELAEPPILSSSGIKLTVKLAKKKVLGVFGGGNNSKEVCLHDPNDNKVRMVTRFLTMGVSFALFGGTICFWRF